MYKIIQRTSKIYSTMQLTSEDFRFTAQQEGGGRTS